MAHHIFLNDRIESLIYKYNYYKFILISTIIINFIFKPKKSKENKIFC